MSNYKKRVEQYIKSIQSDLDWHASNISYFKKAIANEINASKLAESELKRAKAQLKTIKD